MKGIILSGGKGTRLYPASKIINKGLLPIYDKPMVYYPLSVLMLSDIKDIMIISSTVDIARFEELLGDGSKLGLNIKYGTEDAPRGIGNAFLVAEDFIGDDDVCLILGDNIFYGHKLQDILLNSVKIVEQTKDSVIFGYYVGDPERFGVVEFDDKKNVVSIEEKPNNPRSNYAAVGLYYYTNDVVNVAKQMKPSKRGELEITDINNEFLNRNQLKVELLGRGHAWLDTGTHESMMEASTFIKTIEQSQGLKISCPEEIAYRMGYITKDQLFMLSEEYNNSYGQYLKKIAH